MELLLNLMGVSGVSGSEEHVRELISKEIKGYVDEIKVDTSGNLIAVKKGKEPRVMLAAHMDEIGLMVKNIEDNGTIRCSAIGGIKTKSLIGQKVSIETGKEKLCGIIKRRGRKTKKDSINNLVIQTDFSKKDLLKKGLEIGCYASFGEKPKITNNNQVKGKALDDRIGCFALIELAKKLKKIRNEVYFVFTVQEEIGLYGAKTAAFGIQPDWAIAVDASDAKDISKSKKCLGLGPVITIKDSDFIANKCING